MKNKFSFAIVLFVIGFVLAALISVRAFQEAYRSRKIEAEVELLKRDAERVQKENDELSQRIAYLQTPEFQEKIAKEKLNLQKPDENVVVISPSQPQGQSQQETAQAAETEEFRPRCI